MFWKCVNGKSQFIVIIFLMFSIISLVGAETGLLEGNQVRTVVVNPYDDVDWETVKKHKAALHVHTLQSDGFQRVNEVVRAYQRAGFTVLAITDHDWNQPNFQVRREKVPPEKASPYPEHRKDPNYYGNPTWPWTDYGCSAPQELGMIGIQGNELTYRHHINSYYSDYGLWYDRTKIEGFPHVPLNSLGICGSSLILVVPTSKVISGLYPSSSNLVVLSFSRRCCSPVMKSFSCFLLIHSPPVKVIMIQLLAVLLD